MRWVRCRAMGAIEWDRVTSAALTTIGLISLEVNAFKNNMNINDLYAIEQIVNLVPAGGTIRRPVEK